MASIRVGMVEDMDDILRMAETSMSDINALEVIVMRTGWMDSFGCLISRKDIGMG